MTKWSYQSGGFSVGYDDPDDHPGIDFGGYYLYLDAPGKSVEYGLDEETAKEIIRDFDLEAEE